MASAVRMLIQHDEPGETPPPRAVVNRQMWVGAATQTHAGAAAVAQTASLNGNPGFPCSVSLFYFIMQPQHKVHQLYFL